MSDDPTMSDQDKLIYEQVLSVHDALQGGDADDDDVHFSHAVEKYTHMYFHALVHPFIMEQMLAGKPFDIESIMRTVMCSMFEKGYEFARRGFILNECECGELTDEKIKELFPIKGHEHG